MAPVLTMPLAIFALVIFIVGVAFGYAIRSGVSRRRHLEARRRYDATGSFRMEKLLSKKGAKCQNRLARIDPARLPTKETKSWARPISLAPFDS